MNWEEGAGELSCCRNGQLGNEAGRELGWLVVVTGEEAAMEAETEQRGAGGGGGEGRDFGLWAACLLACWVAWSLWFVGVCVSLSLSHSLPRSLALVHLIADAAAAEATMRCGHGSTLNQRPLHSA